MTENSIIASGIIADEPRFSHFSHGVRFYAATLLCERLSGIEDELPVILPEDSCKYLKLPGSLQPGGMVEIQGQIRSYNNKSGVGARLVISILAREVEPFEGKSENRATLAGTLCKAPILRRTPFGREICDLLVCIPRAYGRSDYLPCIAWGGTAHALSLLGAGDHIHINGRLQSREYVKQYEDGSEERKTAYEISVMQSK